MEWIVGAFLAFFLLFVVGVVVLVIFAIRQQSALKRAWRAWALARNWGYRDKWPEMLDRYTKGVMNTGGSAVKGFEGRFDGQHVAGFEYTYTTSTGKSSTTHHHRISMVRVPGAHFPALAISRENFFGKLLGQDIEFEDAEFNRRWFVKGSQPRFAHDVIHPRLMQQLNSGELKDFMSLWFEGDSVLVATNGQVKPEFIDSHLRFLTDVVATVPRFVWNNVGCAHPPPVTRDGPGVSLEVRQQRIARMLDDKA